MKGYNGDYFSTIRNKVAEMFQIAVLHKHIPINKFATLFVNSPIAHAFETADPIYALGKSARELVEILIGEDDDSFMIAESASPEYWVGWVLASAQFMLNKSYKTLISAYPCGDVLDNYFPYHEMDINHIVDIYAEKIKENNPLKTIREQRKLSQSELATISNVPIRNIRAYEQGKLDIAKAQADTVLSLARALNCSFEDLIY